MTRHASLLLGLLLPGAALGTAPDGYYDDADGLVGAPLKEALHDLSADHEVIPYSASSFDVHDAIDILDEDPEDPSSVRLLYSNATAPKDTWPAYNREHVWPQSLGAEDGSPAHSDLHHIFACDASVNSSRGNKPFDDCDGSCDSHPEAPEAAYDEDSWEPPLYQKGDISRALLYMDIRYDGDAGEPDLRVVDALATPGCDCIGWLPELLEWHLLDPVDEAEIERNDEVYALQGNRNPFIDHPEFVCDIWTVVGCESLGGGDPISDDPTPTPSASPTPAPTPSEAPPAYDGPPRPFINEIHYDNEGADEGEGVEVAGLAGEIIDGFSLVFYNGSNGETYGAVSLSGEIDDEGAGMGARFFPVVGIQNGAPDAIALVDSEGHVLEFLSYEGQLTASDGPAEGMVSVDIAVAEEPTTASGMSLQRIGMGNHGEDFEWDGPRASSPGRLNSEQWIQYIPEPTPTPLPTPTPEEPSPTPVEPTPTPFDPGDETPEPIDDPRFDVYDALAIAGEDGTLVERRSRGQAPGRVDSRSPGLTLGDDAYGRARRVVFSFDTSEIPEGEVEGATLRLAITDVVGTPFVDLGPAVVGLGMDAIGGDPALSAEDWVAIEGLEFGGWVDSLPSEGESAIVISIPPEGIALGSQTQVSFSFTVEDDGDRSPDFVTIGSGDHLDEALRPSLEIVMAP